MRVGLLTAVATAIAIGAIAITGGGGSGSTNTAHIFVSTTGSDTCTRNTAVTDYAGSTGHRCLTPSKACSIALSGDTVILEDGTYASHMDGCAVGHQNYAANVVMRPEPGHECTMTYPNVPAPLSDTSCPVNISGDSGDGQLGLSLGGNVGRECGVTGHPLPSTLSASQMSGWDTHLTITGVYIGLMTAQCSAYIEITNDVGNAWYLAQGVYHYYITGGQYGNRTDAVQPTIGDQTVCANPCSDPYPGTGPGKNWAPTQDVRVIRTVQHDFVTYGAGHGDGFFVDPSYDVQLIGNVMARDDCIPMYNNFASTTAQPLGIHGLRVIGNVVHLDTDHNGNGRCGQGISLGDNNEYDTIVAFNSVETPIRRSNGVGQDNTGIQIIGNVASSVSAINSGNTAGCGAGTTASYNILGGGADNCGDATNVTGAASQFVSGDTLPNSANNNISFTAPLGDYTLTAGAAAIGKVPVAMCQPGGALYPYCPTTDPNGNPRPNPAHPTFYDAGAYENR